MQRFAKKKLLESKNRKMKTLEKKHSIAQNSANGRFCEKKASGKLKIEKLKIWKKDISERRTPEIKNRKMNNLKIRHFRMHNSRNGEFLKKKGFGKLKIEK